MTIAHPRIGMDRYVDAEWMELAAGVVLGETEMDGLHVRLAGDIPGLQVRRKTTGILNRMWFPADQAGQDFVVQAAHLSRRGRADRAGTFEAVAIAAYPYFRQIMEQLGRLLKLQETCSAGEVHRRMFEQFGKRTTIDQATSYGFKTLVSWGLIERREGGRIGNTAPMHLTSEMKQLLDLAANRSRGSVSSLKASDPLLFAFNGHHLT